MESFFSRNAALWLIKASKSSLENNHHYRFGADEFGSPLHFTSLLFRSAPKSVKPCAGDLSTFCWQERIKLIGKNQQGQIPKRRSSWKRGRAKRRKSRRFLIYLIMTVTGNYFIHFRNEWPHVVQAIAEDVSFWKFLFGDFLRSFHEKKFFTESF